jgi:hypothetical protein
MPSGTPRGSIKAAARKYGVEVDESSWREIGRRH